MTRFNGRRKPELLDATTYSLVNYREAERVVADYDAVVKRAEAVYGRLPAVEAGRLLRTRALSGEGVRQCERDVCGRRGNALYAAQGRASANAWGEKTKALFKVDADLMTQFNKTFAGGKWDHFMDQPHIGYTTLARSAGEQHGRDPSRRDRGADRGRPRRGDRRIDDGVAGCGPGRHASVRRSRASIR